MMRTLKRWGWLVLLAGVASACATSKDVRRLEAKVDRLLLDTNRSTLEEIFGDQAQVIAQKVDEMNTDQQTRFLQIRQQYEQGEARLEEVRGQMLTLLGGDDREVSTPSGIYLRDPEGRKLRAVADGTELLGCSRLEETDLPAPIREKDVLMQYAWGAGVCQGERILFPWELTISAFTREIAAATARRTAQELTRMRGDKAWSRPIYIQVSTEDAERLTISTQDEDAEVHVVPVRPQGTP